MIIGYAKLSTDGQTLDAQINVLKTAGAEKVFQEKISGARADRPQLSMMLASLKAGDVVVITCLKQLARSSRDLLNILACVGEQGAVFRSLAEPWADTSTPYGELLITVLGGSRLLSGTFSRRARTKASSAPRHRVAVSAVSPS